MLTQAAARAIASRYVSTLEFDRSDGDELVLVDESTMEHPWGWVYFYTARLWLETSEVRYAVTGNAPLLAERVGGALHVLGTVRPVAEYVAAYERWGDPHAKGAA